MCLEVETEKSHAIIDCGSGMLRLANELLAGPCGKGQGEVHIFMTHFHWDHLMGLPFFTPIYIPNNVINIVLDALEASFTRNNTISVVQI